MGKLIFVRHGQTRKNEARTLHTRNDAEDLNAVGVDQMKKVGLELVKLGVDKLYSSKEKRAVESADVIAQIINIKSEQVEDLHERDWGTFVGKPWVEVERKLKKMNLEERYYYTPPKGESWKDFEKRLIAKVKKLVDKNKNIAIVTHGGVIRALMPYLLNKGRNESFKYDFENGSLTVFDFDGKKFRKVVINEISHLK